MTVNELALQLIKEQGESNDNTDYVSVVEQWINDALDEVYAASTWTFLRRVVNLATVGSQAVYDIGSDIRFVLAIRNIADETHIDFVDSPRLMWRGRDLEQTGQPRYWFYKDSQLDADNQQEFRIQFHPVPDSVYNLEVFGYVHPDYIVSASHIPVFKEVILLIKNRVRAYMLADDKDYDGSDRALQMFVDGVEKLKAKDNKNPAARLKFAVRDIKNLDGYQRLAGLDPNHFR